MEDAQIASHAPQSFVFSPRSDFKPLPFRDAGPFGHRRVRSDSGGWSRPEESYSNQERHLGQCNQVYLTQAMPIDPMVSNLTLL
jgi:hypothetical protein